MVPPAPQPETEIEEQFTVVWRSSSCGARWEIVTGASWMLIAAEQPRILLAGEVRRGSAVRHQGAAGSLGVIDA